MQTPSVMFKIVYYALTCGILTDKLSFKGFESYHVCQPLHSFYKQFKFTYFIVANFSAGRQGNLKLSDIMTFVTGSEEPVLEFEIELSI
mgnify:CR=1 FL=1